MAAHPASAERMKRNEQDILPSGEVYRSLPGWSFLTPDPILDRLETPVEKVLVVATVQRSGSSMFVEELRMTEKMGVPREYLESVLTFRAPVRRWPVEGARFRSPRSRLSWRATTWLHGITKGRTPVIGRFSRRSIEAYLRGVSRYRTSSNGVFSIKIMADQLQSFVAPRRGVSMNCFGVPVTWVRLTRADKLGQAISWVRADQSQAWVGQDGAACEAVYDEALLLAKLEKIAASESDLDRFFSERGIDPLHVVYEEHLEDRVATIQRIADRACLGPVDARAGTMPRQTDAASEEWRALFLAAHPDFDE